MHRIDTTTAQKDKFGSGKNGFTGGNPQTGELPTALDADFFDSIQEEIATVIEAAGISLAKANNAQLLAAMRSLVGPGRLLNVQVFTSSGTYTKTPGTKKVRVKSLGGGGAGGGTEVTTSAQIAAAWGGNSGAYAESSLIDVSLVASIAVTIGAAGIPAAGAAGGAGGQSSFGSYLITPGGAGGFIGTAGAGVSAGVDMDTGANPSGTALAFGVPASVGVGPLSLSSTVGQGTMKSGRGADSKLGVGGGGIRGANTAKSAFGYGAGGGGSAVGPSAASTTAGGVGTSGIIIVEEYA